MLQAVNTDLSPTISFTFWARNGQLKEASLRIFIFAPSAIMG